jgi:hypothetical protein
MAVLYVLRPWCEALHGGQLLWLTKAASVPWACMGKESQ